MSGILIEHGEIEEPNGHICINLLGAELHINVQLEVGNTTLEDIAQAVAQIVYSAIHIELGNANANAGSSSRH